MNLNQYYDGLDDYQVNTLFGMFVNLRPCIEMYKDDVMEGDEEIADDEKYTIIRGFSSIDSFMESTNKKSIFHIKEISAKYASRNKFYDELDTMPLIEKM